MLMIGLIVPLTIALVLAVWALGLSSQKIMTLGFLICLAALYFLLLEVLAGTMGLLGFLGFWPGAVLVLAGVFGKNGKGAEKEEPVEEGHCE